MSTLFVDDINEKTSGNGVLIPGHVVQTVYALNTTQKSSATDGITNGAWQATGTSATITPKSATSKILVRIEQSFFYQTDTGGAQGIGIRIYRGSTAITTKNGFASFYLDTGDASNNRHHGYDNSMVLDSPSTTSAVTYSVYGYWWTSDFTDLRYQYDNDQSPSVILLQEIAQ